MRDGHHYLDFVLPDAIDRTTMLGIMERAVRRSRLRVSHIGGYADDPESLHWHIAEGRERRSVIEATYWHAERAFWLSRPAASGTSFRDVAKLQRSLRAEFSRVHEGRTQPTGETAQ